MKPARRTVCNRSARSNARAATKANGVRPSGQTSELIARHHLELDLQCSCQQRVHNVPIWHFICKPVQGPSFGLARQVKHLDLVLMPCDSGFDRHAVMNQKVVEDQQPLLVGALDVAPQEVDQDAGIERALENLPANRPSA